MKQSRLQIAQEFIEFIREEMTNYDFDYQHQVIQDEIDVEIEVWNKKIEIETTISQNDIETTFIDCMEDILHNALNNYKKFNWSSNQYNDKM